MSNGHARIRKPIKRSITSVKIIVINILLTKLHGSEKLLPKFCADRTDVKQFRLKSGGCNYALWDAECRRIKATRGLNDSTNELPNL